MNRHFLNRMFWGFTLIAAGILFLLNQMNLISFDLGTLFSVYWPVILIFFGIKGILFQPGSEERRAGVYLWNGFIILIGTFFLLRNLNIDVFDRIDLWEFIVPVLLILIGLNMLANGSRSSRHSEGPVSKAESAYPKGTIPEPHHPRHHRHADPVTNRSNFIGDIYLGQDVWHLEPTNVSHFIGDTIIDLTKASIPFGETRLTISSFIGDVKVFVPKDTQVEVSVIASAFIGDMNVLDRREGGLFKHVKLDTPLYNEAEKKINLIISVFIGDVLVKRL